MSRAWHLRGASRIAVFSVLGLHLALVAACFGFAFFAPEQSALLPVIVVVADLPISMGISLLDEYIGPAGYHADAIFQGVLFGIVGSLWWCLITWLTVWLIGKGWKLVISRNSAHKQDGTINPIT